MNEVNCGIEARGDDLSVALQVMNVVPEQLNNVGMWQYLRGYLGERPAPGVCCFYTCNFITGFYSGHPQGIFHFNQSFSVNI